MPNIEIVKKNLESRGYKVVVAENRGAAAGYLDSQIDGVAVGISGSVTIQTLEENFGDRLSRHNMVQWHWYNAVDTHHAISAEVYITSANAIAETGEIVNIIGRGNRTSSMVFGHDRLYIVVGQNKIVRTCEEAQQRAKNIAAPLNVKRMSDIGVKSGKTPRDLPCVKNPGMCHDCTSPLRPCNGLMIYWKKPDFIREAEIIIIREDMGL